MTSEGSKQRFIEYIKQELNKNNFIDLLESNFVIMACLKLKIKEHQLFALMKHFNANKQFSFVLGPKTLVRKRNIYSYIKTKESITPLKYLSDSKLLSMVHCRRQKFNYPIADVLVEIRKRDLDMKAYHYDETHVHTKNQALTNC